MFGKDPVMSSVYAIVVTFFLVAVVAYFLKLDMVSEKDAEGYNKVVMSKLVSYSALVSILVGIIVLLVGNFSKRDGALVSSMGRRSGRRYY